MKAILVLSSLLISGVALANSNGPFDTFKYSTDVTCSELNNMIDSHGALVVYEQPAIYSKLVSNASYCSSGERMMVDSIATSDGSCLVNACMQDSRR